MREPGSAVVVVAAWVGGCTDSPISVDTMTLCSGTRVPLR